MQRTSVWLASLSFNGPWTQKTRAFCTIMLTYYSPGSGETDTGTIIKQMKIVHQNGFSDTELAEYRPMVYKDVLDSAQALILYMRETGIECIDCNNRILADRILDYQLELTANFSPDIAKAIHQVWQDPIIPKFMEEHSSEFHLMDSAS